MKTQIKKDIKKLNTMANKLADMSCNYEDLDQYLVNKIDELTQKVDETINALHESLDTTS